MTHVDAMTAAAPASPAPGKPDSIVISLLCPVFNEETHLGSMIASLQDQTHTEWEALFVDDGSSDGTLGILRDAAAKDPRIAIVAAGEKFGKVKAFNLAFAASSGEIIVLVGGDDTLPVESLAVRVAAMAETEGAAVAFFKLRMMSDDSLYDGLVIPRGTSGSRSGPSITLSRQLATELFPVPEQLVAEDIWLGEGAMNLATTIVHSPAVVVNYRVHRGNSNPRHKPFSEMSKSIHERTRPYDLLSRSSMRLSPSQRSALARHWEVETLRSSGRTMAVIFARGIPIVERLAMASMSSRRLFNIRTRYYKLFSGWRGR